MVDEKPGSYRPRRAYPAQPDQTAEPATPQQPSAGASGDTAGGAFDDEAPKPLYRDEVYGADEPTVAIDDRTRAGDDRTGVGDDRTRIRPGASDARTGSSTGSPAESPAERTSEQTQILSRARARAGGPRTPTRRGRDEDQTTILPRTATGGRVRRDPDDDDLLDEESGPKRNRTGLLIGAVAAVVILGLALGYTVLSLTRQSAAPGVAPSAPAGSTAPSGPSGSPAGPDASALLTDAMLLSPRIAAKIADDRTWKVQLTQKGQSADSPQPACLGGDPVEGQPIPQQSLLRVLNSTGTNPPAVLQQADAYATPEEAAQAYAVAARTLGGCTMAATSIESGATVSGLGDQALGLILRVSDGSKSEFRTVVLARTGQVLDVVDVAQVAKAVELDQVAMATADVLNTQCRAARGTCATGVRVTPAPPPVGGDAPGFLATADLPPVGTAATTWVANKPQTPTTDVQGSGCERVNWSKEPAQARAWRTYLLQDSPSKFGLDEVVLTMKSNEDATKLAEKVRDDWADCEKRQLTATVTEPKKLEAVGARNTPIQGWTTTVQQKVDNATVTFRVGIAAAGPKVVFTFLNPQDKLDLTDEQFAAVTARAGQRATQVK